MSKSPAETLRIIDQHREAGNTHFREDRLSKAIYEYHCATMYIKDLEMRTSQQQNHILGMIQGESESLTDEEKTRFEEVVSSVFNNMAAVYIKQKKYAKAVTAATKVLEIQPRNTKALFRRGKSHILLNNTDEAESDLSRAQELNPDDTAIRKELLRLEKLKSFNEAKAKKFYAKCLQG